MVPKQAILAAVSANLQIGVTLPPDVRWCSYFTGDRGCMRTVDFRGVLVLDYNVPSPPHVILGAAHRWKSGALEGYTEILT